VLTFNTNVLCYAKDSKNMEQLISEEEVGCKEEREAVKEILNQSMKDMDGLLSYDRMDINEFDMSNAYKAYNFIDENIVEEYKKTGSFEQLISDKYTWKIPTSTNYLITMRKNEDKNDWKVMAISNELQNDMLKSAVDITNTTNISEIIINENKINEVQKFKYVISNLFGTTFTYLSADDKEYIIPYGTRPDLTGLDNGCLYEVEDAINILDAHFELPDNLSIGGINSDHSEEVDRINTIPFVIIILLAIGLLFVYHIYKSKLNTKK